MLNCIALGIYDYLFLLLWGLTMWIPRLRCRLAILPQHSQYSPQSTFCSWSLNYFTFVYVWNLCNLRAAWPHLKSKKFFDAGLCAFQCHSGESKLSFYENTCYAFILKWRTKHNLFIHLGIQLKLQLKT